MEESSEKDLEGEILKLVTAQFFCIVSFVITNNGMKHFKIAEKPKSNPIDPHIRKHFLNDNKFKPFLTVSHMQFISIIYYIIADSKNELSSILKPYIENSIISSIGWSKDAILNKIGMVCSVIMDKLDFSDLDLRDQAKYGESLGNKLSKINIKELEPLCRNSQNPGWVPLKEWDNRKYDVSDNLMMVHFTLPLTRRSNLWQSIMINGILPEHKRVLAKNIMMTEDPTVISSFKLVYAILIDPKTVVGPYVMLPIPIGQTSTLNEIKQVIINCFKTKKCFIGEERDSAYGNLNKDLEDVQISRYDLKLIRDTEPSFEDGEKIWINHVKHKGRWRVITHDSKLPFVEDKICSWCFERTDKKCGKCSTSYCSAACQKLDWSTHKVVCK